jgi:hypothetical protein
MNQCEFFLQTVCPYSYLHDIFHALHTIFSVGLGKSRCSCHYSLQNIGSLHTNLVRSKLGLTLIKLFRSNYLGLFSDKAKVGKK